MTCHTAAGHEKCFLRCFTAESRHVCAINNQHNSIFTFDLTIFMIAIPQGRDATPYLERNRVGRDAIDSAAALTDMGKYLFRERRLPVYDIAVAITK